MVSAVRMWWKRLRYGNGKVMPVVLVAYCVLFAVLSVTSLVGEPTLPNIIRRVNDFCGMFILVGFVYYMGLWHRARPLADFGARVAGHLHEGSEVILKRKDESTFNAIVYKEVRND